MNSTAIQAEEYFNIQIQLIKKQTGVVEYLLGQTEGDNLHSIDFQNESVHSVYSVEPNSHTSK